MSKTALTYVDWTIGFYTDAMSKRQGRPATVQQGLALFRQYVDSGKGAHINGPAHLLPDGRRVLDVAIPQRLTRDRELNQADVLQVVFQQDGLRPILDRTPTLRAVQVTESLLATFAHVPSHYREEAWALLLAHEWYFDFMPVRLPFEIDGETHYVRALTLNPLTGLSGEVTRTYGTLPAVLYYDNARDELIGEDYQHWDWRRPYGGQPLIGAFSFAMREMIEDLVEHCVLYLTMARPEYRQPLPQTKPEQVAKMHPVRGRKTLDRTTLFNVVSLQAPADRLGRPDTGRRTGWTLDKRISVRDHFRMQAHGPGHTLRRLQWIEAFERGPKTAEPGAVKLYRLAERGATDE